MRRVSRMALRLLVAVCFFATMAVAWRVSGQAPAGGVTVYEGARLITGDGSAPIENSAFIVQNDLFTRVGRRGEMQVPAGARRVDLTGKTVMPTKVDLHGHIGYQHDVDGTMAKEYFTRENLIDHLQRLAYYGFSAVISVGDLVDRSDLHGGRTGWGDVPLRVRNEIIPGAALFRTTGTGISYAGAGPQGHPSRTDVPYQVTTVAEARAAVQDYARIKPEFIKIWVDDRDGTLKTLTPELFLPSSTKRTRSIFPVAAHNITLANAKLLMRAGVEGWLHLPVRMGEVPDDELIAIIKDRIAKNDRPNDVVQSRRRNRRGDPRGLERSAAAGHDFAGADPGAGRRATGENHAGIGRARPSESQDDGRHQCAEAPRGGHEDRQRQRHRTDAVLHRLGGTVGVRALGADGPDAVGGDRRGDARFGRSRPPQYRDGGGGQVRRLHRPRRQSRSRTSPIRDGSTRSTSAARKWTAPR